LLYVAKSGDTLAGIAARFGINPQTILANNVICNPNLIFIGQPILIPDPGIEYQKAGGYPYYVVQYGDTISCLSSQFVQTVKDLAAANQLPDPNRLFVGDELLVRFNVADPKELFKTWSEVADRAQCLFSSLEEHGVYYIGSFQWETIEERAVPYLARLLKHSCKTVRFFAVMSLGRIAKGPSLRVVLQEALTDTDPEVRELAKLAIRRTTLVQRYTKRLHIVIANQQLYAQPNSQSPSIFVPKGSEVISLRWGIPSAINEEGPRGDLQIYDQIQLISSGQAGYLPRVGFNDIQLI
jgi:LysM repeat protein